MLAALNDKSQLGACPLVPNHTAVFIFPKTDGNKRDNSMLTVCPYVCMFVCLLTGYYYSKHSRRISKKFSGSITRGTGDIDYILTGPICTPVYAWHASKAGGGLTDLARPSYPSFASRIS